MSLITFNSLGNILSVDIQWLQMFGYLDVCEILGKDVRTIFASPYREEDLSSFAVTNRTRRMMDCVNKSGTIFSVVVEISKLNQLGSSGISPSDNCNNANDVFTASLHKKDTQPAVATITKDGDIIFTNPKFDDIFCCDSRDMIGGNVTKFLPDLNVKQDLQRTFSSPFFTSSIMGSPVNMSPMISLPSLQNELFFSSPKSTVASLHVGRDKHGNLMPIFASVGRKEMGLPGLTSITHSELELLELILIKLSSQIEVSFLVKTNGTIVSSSTEYIQCLFGVTVEEMIGRDIHSFIRLPPLAPFTFVSSMSTIPEDPSQTSEPSEIKLNRSNSGFSKKRKSSFSNDVLDFPTWALSKQPVRVELTTVALPFDLAVEKVKTVSKGDCFHVRMTCVPEASEYIRKSMAKLQQGHSRVDGELLANGGSNGGSLEDFSGLLASPSNGNAATVGDYLLVKKISTGPHGSVYEAVHRITREVVAIKLMQKDLMSCDKNVLERAKQECEVMKKLNHPNIINMIEYIETPSQLCIVMEYCPDGDLETYLKSKGGKLTEAEARYIFIQLVNAVAHCHQHNVIHRDIKLENALLKQGTVKLIDFNVSRVSEGWEERTTFCGTPTYLAPEIILNSKYAGVPVDIYSLGVLLYIMLVGQPPFSTIGDTIKGEYTIPDYISAECMDLLQRMLCINPKNRATMTDLQQHPWVKAQQS